MAEEQGGWPGIVALLTTVKFALATAQIIEEEWDNGIKPFLLLFIYVNCHTKLIFQLLGISHVHLLSPR